MRHDRHQLAPRRAAAAHARAHEDVGLDRADIGVGEGVVELGERAARVHPALLRAGPREARVCRRLAHPSSQRKSERWEERAGSPSLGFRRRTRLRLNVPYWSHLKGTTGSCTSRAQYAW